MQASIGGSARMQGVGSVPGLSNSSNTNPAVRAAVYIWVAAVVVLFIFHVGGAHV